MVRWKIIPQYHTNRFERLLLLLTIACLPLENHIPTISRFSIAFIIFAFLGIYILLVRPHTLIEMLGQPLFYTAYIFMVIIFVVELSHPLSSYFIIFRTGQMFVGAIFISSLCRDKAALRASIYGYLVAGIGLSILLFLTVYGALQDKHALGFTEATMIRGQALEENPLDHNWNFMAFISAQNAAVALALGLTDRERFRRNIFLGISFFCLFATFLPMSRSGLLIVMVSSAVVVFVSGVQYGKLIFIISVSAVIISAWVPDVVWSRMSFTTQAQEGQMESRARVYTAAVAHIPDYIWSGVGSGNFWISWGRRSRFFHRGVSGAHNVFFQVAIYWGLPALAALIAVVWQAYRCLPGHSAEDPLALCLVGIGVSLIIWAQVSHNFYAKEFATGLGLLVGARRWIWPVGLHRQTAPRVRPQRVNSRL